MLEFRFDWWWWFYLLSRRIVCEQFAGRSTVLVLVFFYYHGFYFWNFARWLRMPWNRRSQQTMEKGVVGRSRFTIFCRD